MYSWHMVDPQGVVAILITVIYCFYKVYQMGTINMAIYRLCNKNKIMYKNTKFAL